MCRNCVLVFVLLITLINISFKNYFLVEQINAQINQLESDLASCRSYKEVIERELAPIRRSPIPRDVRRATHLLSRLTEVEARIVRIIQQQSRLYVQLGAEMGVTEATLRETARQLDRN